MSRARLRLGAQGEQAARDFLEKKGYTIREVRYRSRHGEIDLIAQREDSLVFVEVRTRIGDHYGLPEESITPIKQHRLMTTAMTYLQSHGLSHLPWRIDLVALNLSPQGRVTRIEHIPSIVEG